MLTVREMQVEDISKIIYYWLTANDTYLWSMGASGEKIPTKEEWEERLADQLKAPYTDKKSYCIIWLLNNEAVGHCNVNNIVFGEEAYMHLHMWRAGERKQGYGTEFVKKSLPYFFKNLQLQKLFCEPYALNDAPNKTLQKLGFTFIKEYITTPGPINFEQPVTLWQLDRNKVNDFI
jgi:RimJ/RimL family protein N-acetyltransferase